MANEMVMIPKSKYERLLKQNKDNLKGSENTQYFAYGSSEGPPGSVKPAKLKSPSKSTELIPKSSELIPKSTSKTPLPKAVRVSKTSKLNPIPSSSKTTSKLKLKGRKQPWLTL